MDKVLYHLLDGSFARAKNEIKVVTEQPDLKQYHKIGEKFNPNYKIDVYILNNFNEVR